MAVIGDGGEHRRRRVVFSISPFRIVAAGRCVAKVTLFSFLFCPVFDDLLGPFVVDLLVGRARCPGYSGGGLVAGVFA